MNFILKNVTDEPNMMGVTKNYFRAPAGDDCFDIDIDASEYNPRFLPKGYRTEGSLSRISIWPAATTTFYVMAAVSFMRK
jgi:hypothetical protein